MIMFITFSARILIITKIPITKQINKNAVKKCIGLLIPNL